MKDGADSLEEGLRVAVDVPCVGCGYNLRMLMVTGLCPECAMPVAPSIEAERATATFNLKRVRRGAVLLAFSMLIESAFSGGLYFGHVDLLFNDHEAIRTAVLSIISFVVSGLAFGGIFQLCQSRTRRPEHEAIRLICLMYPLLPPGLLFLFVVVQNVVTDAGWYPEQAQVFANAVWTWLVVLAGVWQLGVYVIGFHFTRQLGRRLKWGRFATYSALAFVAGGVITVVTIFYMSLLAVVQVRALWISTPTWIEELANYCMGASIVAKGFQFAGFYNALNMFIYWMTVAWLIRRHRLSALGSVPDQSGAK